MKILWWSVSILLLRCICGCREPQVVKSSGFSQGSGGSTPPKSVSGTATTTPATTTVPALEPDDITRGGGISPNLGVDPIRLDSFKREQAKIKRKQRQNK